MALSGSLQDLPLIDALQILSVSAKSGLLVVTSGTKVAEIGLLQGNIVSASTKPRLRYIGDVLIDQGVISLETLHAALRQQRAEQGTHKVIGAILLDMQALTTEQLASAMRQYVQTIVNDVATWMTGQFVFTAGDPEVVDDLSFLPDRLVRSFELRPQEILLEAVRMYDEAREKRSREQQRLLRSTDDVSDQTLDEALSEEKPSTSLRHAVLITSNIYVRHAMQKAWDGTLVRLHTPMTVEDAVGMLKEGHISNPLVLLDTDATSVDGVDVGGGLEALERLSRGHGGLPVVSFGNADDPQIVALAIASGVRQHVPVPVWIDGDGSAAAMDNVLAAIAESVRRWLRDGESFGVGSPSAGGEGAWLDQLYERMVSLRTDSQSSTVALEMLKFLASRLDRAILFLASGGELIGLGAFGLPDGSPQLGRSLAHLRVPIASTSAVQIVLKRGTLAVISDAASDPTLAALHGAIGAPASGEALLVPLVVDAQPVSLVYADHGVQTAKITRTGPLGLLVEHAALLLENVLLRRKLRQHTGGPS